MNDPLFEELLESVREGAAIIRGEARPSRLFKINNQVSGVEMPEISRFYGIIIRMFVEQNAPHHRPHFHAYYQKRSAVYGLDPIELISGQLSPKERRLVEAWAELHNEELSENWNRIRAGETVLKIAPLK